MAVAQRFNINHLLQPPEFSSPQLNSAGSAVLHISSTACLKHRTSAVLNTIHKKKMYLFKCFDSTALDRNVFLYFEFCVSELNSVFETTHLLMPCNFKIKFI